MTICIIKNNNGSFEAKEYFPTKEPLNLVLKVPEFDAINTNNFLLVETGVTVSWNNYYGTTRWRILEVRYKNTLIFEKNGVKNIQVVIDILNKYKTISKVDLEKALKESQEIEKSKLEISLEELRAEKKNLEQQINIYKAIQTKKDEIKALLEKLDE